MLQTQSVMFDEDIENNKGEFMRCNSSLSKSVLKVINFIEEDNLLALSNSGAVTGVLKQEFLLSTGLNRARFTYFSGGSGVEWFLT